MFETYFENSLRVPWVLLFVYQISSKFSSFLVAAFFNLNNMDLSDASLRTEFEIVLETARTEQRKSHDRYQCNGYGKEQVYCLDRCCVTEYQDDYPELKFIYKNEDLDHQTENLAEIHHKPAVSTSFRRRNQTRVFFNSNQRPLGTTAARSTVAKKCQSSPSTARFTVI